jgi:acyl-CoA thioesterase
MEDLKNFFERDQFARHCGIELVTVSPGHAIARLKVEPRHLNALGIVQGGAVFTLADFAFAAASNTHGKAAVAINVSITYLKASSSGTLQAEARELGINPKLGTYTVDITDEKKGLIAVFQGLVYRKNQDIAEAAR